jgi:hypothetical protein
MMAWAAGVTDNKDISPACLQHADERLFEPVPHCRDRFGMRRAVRSGRSSRFAIGGNSLE